MQDLLYTVAVAALLLSCLIAVHAVAILMYKLLVGTELHPYLSFPRIEVVITGRRRNVG